MASTLFGLYELGSNSLKFYVVGEDGSAESLTTYKVPWRIAHEVYGQGGLSDRGIEEIISAIVAVQAQAGAQPIAGALTIATGVFRDLDQLELVQTRVQKATGLRVRVISGADEAALMARGFRRLSPEPPVLLCDLGGGTTEWVWVPKAGPTQSGSVRLGAIRGCYQFAGFDASSAEYLEVVAAHCDECLADLPVRAPAAVIATGGTAQAASEVVGSQTIYREALHALIDQVQRLGPPPSLKDSRKPVFLPGLIILARILERCAASEFRFGAGAVREGLVRRLLQLMERFSVDELRATQLLHKTRGR
jgi:exopolyphosphatase / guanosine-5'-triphosphate,3'-diphosphate pyrophosphatase